MVPAEYHEFFTAVASVAGALIGLLFVAISVAPERITGEHAQVREQARAATALTSFLLPLTVALVALLPGSSIGWVAALLGALGLLSAVGSVRRLLSVADRPKRQALRDALGLVGFGVVMVLNAVYGVELLVDPRAAGKVEDLAALTVIALLIGVERAWLLIGARDRSLTATVRDIVQGERPAPRKGDRDD